MPSRPHRLEFGKGQLTRVLDVLLLGPVMIVGGTFLGRGKYPLLGFILTASGAATIVFNGSNFIEVRRELERRAQEAA